MNMQQMLMQAQKMQRELQKAQNELKEKEFTVSKGGAVTVVVKGDHKIKSIVVDEDAFDKDNKDMVEEMIAMATNEAIGQPLDPAKKYIRSETVDFQPGEVEWSGGNLFYDAWNSHMEINSIEPIN